MPLIWIGLLAFVSALVTNTAYSLEHDAAALSPRRPFRSVRMLGLAAGAEQERVSDPVPPGAFLTGVDPSPAGLAAARDRAAPLAWPAGAIFQHGTFAHTNLADEAAAW